MADSPYVVMADSPYVVMADSPYVVMADSPYGVMAEGISRWRVEARRRPCYHRRDAAHTRPQEPRASHDDR